MIVDSPYGNVLSQVELCYLSSSILAFLFAETNGKTANDIAAPGHPEIVLVLRMVVLGGQNEPVDLVLVSYRSYLGECSVTLLRGRSEGTGDNAYPGDMASTRRSSFVNLIFASVCR